MTIAFIGDNAFAREQAAREYILGFTNVHGSMAVDKFVGEDTDFATLNDAVSTVPFLSPRRLVVVRDFGTNKLLADKLETLVTAVADSTDFVIIESHIDGRSKYLTNLKKLAEVRQFTHLEVDALVAWVVEQTNKLGGSIDRMVAQKLVDRVGQNQQLIANELQKLVLYNPQITEQSINELTSYNPQSSIFAMLDAAFSGKPAEALRLYQEQRDQGMEPQAILGMITWQLHVLTVIKAAGNMSAQDIAARSKLSPFLVRKNQTNAKRISVAKLIKILEQAIKTDLAMKSIAIDADEAVQTLIFSFA